MNQNINKINKMTGEITTTNEGGMAYALSFKEEIVEFFCLGLLRGTFYQTEEEVLKNGKELFERALKECPEFATKAAVYGNNVNSLKLVPMIWLAYVSTLEDKTLFKAAFPKIIRNPGMLFNFMEIVRKTNIRKGLGRSLKKAMNDWMIENLNEYQVSRNKNKLAEVVHVTRPASNDEVFQNYMKYLIKDELTFERAIALKSVIDSLSNGVYGEQERALVKAHRLQLEELKHAVKTLDDESKKTLYKDMYSSLSYAALILNLVALERVYATKTTTVNKYSPSRGYYKSSMVVDTDIPRDVIEMVVARIEDLKAYRKSNMLPFALMNAEKMVVTREFKQAIANVFAIAANEAFNIDKDTTLLLGVDTSGSMSGQMCNDHLSAADVACMFGGMIRKSHPKTDVVAVATETKPVKISTQMNVTEIAKAIERTDVGYGTYFENLMKFYKGQKYVILITDSEQADNLEKKWKRAKRPDGSKLIVWQLTASKTKISKDPSVINLCGYSDRILALVKTVIEGNITQVEEVEAVVL